MYQKVASTGSKALSSIDTLNQNQMTNSRIFQTHDDCNSLPWDEGNDEVANRAALAGNDYKCLSDIRPSDTWRRIGQARRRFLLEDDTRKGGTTFALNFNCEVDRYFDVAHRALEQFHKMYQVGSDHEETYIMGNRMVCFLTECLPTHPGFHQPSVSHLRRQCFIELEKLHNCLEDVALTIDEEQCDKFADDYEPEVDSDSDDEDFSTSVSPDWAIFQEKRSHHRLIQSPTSTVNTTGTASLDSTDSSSSDDEIAESNIRHALTTSYSEESPKEVSFLVDISTDFLDQIAEEDVEYEVDSEAYDSWAQGDDSESFATSLSSCQGLKCDPARSALQGMWSRARKARLSRSKGGMPDPPNKDQITVPELDFLNPKDSIPNHLCYRESVVAGEIQRFLDASFEYDPAKVFDYTMEQFSSGKANVGSSNRPARSSTPHPFSVTSNRESSPMPSSENQGLDWPRFEPPRSYRVANSSRH